ncbi:hypothetical protein MD484_g7698, partial [Candolleomyces efflorescens]
MPPTVMRIHSEVSETLVQPTISKFVLGRIAFQGRGQELGTSGEVVESLLGTVDGTVSVTPFGREKKSSEREEVLKTNTSSSGHDSAGPHIE